ncbi:ABC transporter ATP-binding protein [Paenibacillus albidus]|uniref:ABC transporter ATP-binding protein n=1 Tax=Paenibacillus albidus TaxID=2041023 RepID=A0A917FCA8_9BACL|nr:ABC transporter ATP-binding protein [Paenibacillus albidus]GGF64356.1 ABC transporter ATP-binding protein [Paenibacillus albidus]
MRHEPDMPLVEVNSIGKCYGKRQVLDGICMRVERGAATALIGRNGSGKSTLLSILAGLIQPTSGQVIYEDPKVTIGYAPEIFPGLKFTPEQYLQSIGRISGLEPLELKRRIGELMERFHLAAYRSHPMPSFSKGMLQKVNLMQSLLMQPKLLLLDEPLSGLDQPAQQQLMELLLERKREGAAIVFTVHEEQMAQALADKIHMLQGGRTVNQITGKEPWQLQRSAYIVCSGLTKGQQLSLASRPGFLSWKEVTEEFGPEHTGFTVKRSVSDDFLREVLGSGGSILSVEPGDGQGYTKGETAP